MELVLVVGLLEIILIWPIYTEGQTLLREDAKAVVLNNYPGIESPFVRIEKYFQDHGLQCGPENYSPFI